jgi:hypothetical protein
MLVLQSFQSKIPLPASPESWSLTSLLSSIIIIIVVVLLFSSSFPFPSTPPSYHHANCSFST